MSFSPNPILMGRAPPLEVANISLAEQCARPVANEVGAPLFGGNSLNLHQFMRDVSGGCLALTVISCVYLTWTHLRRYTVPQEQRQIIRIANVPVFYCLFNFLALCWYPYYQYIEPIARIYEAFCVAALFFLLLEYIAPDGTDREKFFNNLEARSRRGKPLPGGSLKWFQRIWSSCLQYPLMRTVFVLIEIITQYYDKFCENSFSPKHAHLYMRILDYIFVGGAVGANFQFIRRFGFKGFDPKHHVKAKLFSFLGIIIFQLLQDLIFHLMNGKLFNPTATATFNDLNFGIPSFMTCIESVIFSLVFIWSFNSREYKETERMDRYGAGPAQRKHTASAILNAMNLSDIIAGTVLAFQMLFMRVRSQYGGRSSSSGSPDRKPFRDEETSLEPLSNFNRAQPYGSQQGEYDETMVANPAYDASNYNNVNQFNSQLGGTYSNVTGPMMPSAARDPSPPHRARTYRADHLRPEMDAPEMYERLIPTERGPSPAPAPPRDPRQMV